MSRAIPAGDRYEARRLPPVGEAPALWGAWDKERADWVRTPGPDRREEWFTTWQRVELWIAQQEAAVHPQKKVNAGT